MKKIFSLLLTVALLLSAVAFPAAVSAEGEAIEVYFVNNAETVYPGDEITVRLMAKATTDDVVTSYASVYFIYDTNILTMAANTAVNEDAQRKGVVSWISEAEKTIPTTGIELAALTFTVADIPGDSTTLAISQDMPPSFTLTDKTNEATVTAQNLPINFTPNNATVHYYNGTEFVALQPTGYTHTDVQGITVKAIKTGNVDFAIAGPEGFDSTSVDLTAEEGVTLDVEGPYTITVTPVGGVPTTYTFTLSLRNVNAKLSISAPENTTGYAPGASISLPVSISGLDGATASTVKFELTYDENYLTLVENALLSLKGEAGNYTVIYNEAASTDNNKTEGVLTNLDFTVNAATEETVYGKTTVRIEAKDLALVTTSVNPTATEIATLNADANVTIVPAAGTAFATLSGQKEAYTKEAYNIAVAPVAGATVKYFTSDEALDEETIVPADKFDTAFGIENNTINIADMKYYYVVAAIGENPPVYSYIGEIKGMYDNEAPVLPEIAPESTWAKTRTIDVTVTEATTGAAVKNYYYHIDDEEEFTETTSASITINSTTAKIYVKVDDVAGNTSAVKEYTINVDTTAPEATLTNNGRTEGGVELAITARDANSGIKAVELFNGENKVADITLAEGSAKYVVSTAGSYTVKVTDNSGEEGNTFTTDAVDVTITVATLKRVQAALYEDGTVAEGLVEGGVNNGTFMYVKLAKPDDEDNYTTTYTLGETALDFTSSDYYEITPDANETKEYILTVTTTNNDDASDTKSTTYKFSIAKDVYAMKSVNDNAYFNAFDYANLVRVTTNIEPGTAADISNDTAFTGGLLSADVNADMKITEADAAAVLQAMKAVEYVGIYNFNILNNVKDSNATLQ